MNRPHRLAILAAASALLLCGVHSAQAFSQVPPNAYASGDRWFCNDGFKRIADKCEPVVAPSNAYVIGDRWYCKNGFAQVGDACHKVVAPANAYVFGDRWYCRSGFKQVDDECVSLAPVSTASGSAAVAAGGQMPRARSYGSDAEELRALSEADRTMIEAACDSARLVGPAAHFVCVDEQLSALRRTSKHPNLRGLAPDDRAAIETACDDARLVSGPAGYYDCLDAQMAALRATAARPDLRLLSPEDRALVESICNGARFVTGSAAYDDCLYTRVRALQTRSGISRAGASDTAGASVDAVIPGRATSQRSSKGWGGDLDGTIYWAGVISLALIAGGITGFVTGNASCRGCGAPTRRPGRVCKSCRRMSARHAAKRRKAEGERQKQGSRPASGASGGFDQVGHDVDLFDAYSVLGVKPDATQEEIRAAYRGEMSKFHPDKVTNLGSELQDFANKRARELNRAYAMLHRN